MTVRGLNRFVAGRRLSKGYSEGFKEGEEAGRGEKETPADCAAVERLRLEVKPAFGFGTKSESRRPVGGPMFGAEGFIFSLSEWDKIEDNAAGEDDNAERVINGASGRSTGAGLANGACELLDSDVRAWRWVAEASGIRGLVTCFCFFGGCLGGSSPGLTGRLELERASPEVEVSIAVCAVVKLEALSVEEEFSKENRESTAAAVLTVFADFPMEFDPEGAQMLSEARAIFRSVTIKGLALCADTCAVVRLVEDAPAWGTLTMPFSASF